MKLNLGCGRKPLEGYTNIDLCPDSEGVVPDIVCDLKSIPLDDGCADEILAIHVFEHFPVWEVEDLIAEWRRLLKPGGQLILELPDLAKCCKNVIDIENGKTLDQFFRVRHIDQPGMWGLYGDPRGHNSLMQHKWGWTPKTLTKFLKGHGFDRIIVTDETLFHTVGRRLRDMRIEAMRV